MWISYREPYLKSPALWCLRVMSASPRQSVDVSARLLRPLGTDSHHPLHRPIGKCYSAPCSSLQPLSQCWVLSHFTTFSPVTPPNSHNGCWKDGKQPGSFLNFNLSGVMQQESLNINSENNRSPGVFLFLHQQGICDFYKLIAQVF